MGLTNPTFQLFQQMAIAERGVNILAMGNRTLLDRNSGAITLDLDALCELGLADGYQNIKEGHQVFCAIFSDGTVLIDLQIDTDDEPATAEEQLVQRERERKANRDQTASEQNENGLMAEEREKLRQEL